MDLRESYTNSVDNTTTKTSGSSLVKPSNASYLPTHSTPSIASGSLVHDPLSGPGPPVRDPEVLHWGTRAVYPSRVADTSAEPM